MKYTFSLLFFAIIMSCSTTEEPTTVETNEKLILKIDKSKFGSYNSKARDSLILVTGQELSH